MSDESPVPLLYPPYIERKYPQRTLALFDNAAREFTLETGEHISVASFADVRAAMFDCNLLTFIDSLVAFPWLDDIIEEADPTKRGSTAIFCTQQGEMINARLRNKRYTRWLITAFSWGLPGVSRELLLHLRELYDHAGVGTQTTPGAIGQALMRRAWREQYGTRWVEHRHLRPPGHAVDLLHEHSTGPRSELIEGQAQKYHPTIIEIDRKSAYPDAMKQEQPTGHTIRFARGMVQGLKKWFARCTVTITSPLLLGCFPVRRKNSDKETEVMYPTQPGEYETYLWNDEAYLCTEEGCLLDVHDGYGWRATTTDPAAWVKTLEFLKNTAPSEFVAGMIKLVGVAGIGRHGMPDTSYQVGKQPSALEVSHAGHAYDWYVHAIKDDHPTNMQHWFSHTLMQCRLALYKEAKKWREQEMLVATNVDAVFVLPTADVSSYIPKDDSIIGVPTGTWRTSTLHAVTFPANRHIDSLEKTRHPGRKKTQRIGRP